MSLPKHAGIIAVVGAFTLAVLAVIVFTLGRPTTMRVSPQVAASAQVASPQPTDSAASDPLAVEIPGCVCHSEDPVIVAEHASYRMSECFDCHGDSMPVMGR